MAQRTNPYAEAVERMVEAMTQNAAGLARCLTDAAVAVGSAADQDLPVPPGTGSGGATTVDALAASMGSAWLAGMRAMATTAAATIDAAGILTQPPRWVDRHGVDLAWQLGSRTYAVDLDLVSVAWSKPGEVGDLPAVTVDSALPLPVPEPGGVDLVHFSVSPPVFPEGLSVIVELSDPSGTVPPAQYDLRLDGSTRLK